jgi:protein involved in temperature-dependent protein secretion
MMEAVIAAVIRGDYPEAYELLRQAPEAATVSGKAMAAVLLALTERFDEADQVVADDELAGLRVVVQGERQRVTRWRVPEANGSLDATTEDALIPLYVAVATAFVRDNQDLADKAKAQLTEHARPIAGRVTFVDGEVLAFADITDGDDSIGQMLETYCGEGLLYFPFSSLRRIEVLPRDHVVDHLLPKVRITSEDGVGQAFVPMLYCGSATSSMSHVRTGATTLSLNLGQARRGHGQRIFIIDGTKHAPLFRIASIDFGPAPAA